MRCVKEGSTGCFIDVLDATFGDPILMVGVDATKGERLVSDANGFFEQLGVVKAVVGMVVGNSHSMVLGNAFERHFGFNGRFSIHLRHEVNVSEVGIVIDENSCTDVSILSRWTAVSGYKSGSRAD